MDLEKTQEQKKQLEEALQVFSYFFILLNEE